MSASIEPAQFREHLNHQINHALESANYTEAVRLLGLGLGQATDRDNWLDVLEQIIRQAPDVYALVQLGAEPSPEQLSMLAYVQAVSGHIDNGIRTLFRAHHMAPHRGYMRWLSRWSDWPGMIKSLDLNVLLKELMRLLKQHTSPKRRNVQQSTFQELIPTLYKLLEHHGNNGRLLWVTSAMLRQIEQHAQAVKMAQRAFQQDKRWPMAMNLGFARRSAGDVDGAVEAFQIASRIEPDNVSSVIELSITLCQAERYDDGLKHLDRILAHTPNHPEAMPVWCYFQLQATGDETYYLQLENYIHEHPQNTHAAQYYNMLREEAPFVRYLPMADDASIQSVAPLCASLDHRADDDAPPQGFRLDVERMEAPSVGIALDLVCSHYQIPHYDYVLHQTDPTTPDPRKSHQMVQYTIWTYDGMWPQAQIPTQVPEELQLHITTMAKRIYHLPTWWKVAGMVAEQLDHHHVDFLPSALLDIARPCPEQFWPWQWVQRNQTAAMLILAQYAHAKQAPWPKQMLCDIALGPVDWSNTAALLAMFAWSQHDQMMAMTLEQTILELFERAKQWPWCCYGACLLSLARALPNFPKEDLKEIDIWYHAFFEEDDMA